MTCWKYQRREKMKSKKAFQLAKEEIARKINKTEKYIQGQERGPSSDQDKKFYDWKNIPRAEREIEDLKNQLALIMALENFFNDTEFNLLLDTVKTLSFVPLLSAKRDIEDPQTASVNTWLIKNELSYYKELTDLAEELLLRAKKKEELIKNLKKI